MSNLYNLDETLPQAFNAPADLSISLTTASVSTRVQEGLSSSSARFGQSFPFLKPGANTPSFAELEAKAVTNQLGAAGTAFGGSQLSNSQQLALETSIANAATTSTQTAAQTKASTSQKNLEDRTHLVSLSDGETTIEFKVMPDIQEDRSVDYEAVQPPQSPGAFQKYKGTSSTDWGVNVTFISRTSEEATQNLKNINILRAWTMPFYGTQTAIAHPEKIGAPPPVLIFKGFRNAMIGPVPVVMTSLNWSWPKDVDYIPARAPGEAENATPNVPFPTVLLVAIRLKESYSADEFSNFNINNFRIGDFKNAFPQKARPAAENTVNHTPQLEAQAVQSSAETARLQRQNALLANAKGISDADAGIALIKKVQAKPTINERTMIEKITGKKMKNE